MRLIINNTKMRTAQIIKILFIAVIAFKLVT